LSIFDLENLNFHINEEPFCHVIANGMK